MLWPFSSWWSDSLSECWTFFHGNFYDDYVSLKVRLCCFLCNLRRSNATMSWSIIIILKGVVFLDDIHLDAFKIFWADDNWFSSIITLLEPSTTYVKDYVILINNEKAFHFRILSHNTNLNHGWSVHPHVIYSHKYNFLRFIFHPLFCAMLILRNLTFITCIAYK